MHILKWLFSALILFMIAGMGYQFAGMVLDRSHYPPPGQMIDVGGHRLHLYCMGTGSPTVVLEAAAPGWSLYWSLVQPDVAKITRVCAYDRAGLGWSERGPLPRTGQRMARELHQLLTRAGISGPYILVGHSLGGFVARLYREEHPADIVGMVLVDAGHESEMRQAEFRTFVNTGKSMLPAIRAMAVLGVPRIVASFGSLPQFFSQQEDRVPEKVRSMLRAGWLRTSYTRALSDEGDALIETLEQVRHVGPLGDLPLAVLTATGPVWWPDMPGEVNPVKFRKMWLELQEDLTKLSSNSRQVFADQSGHFIQFDQPELVITAIRRLVETAHQKSTGNR